MPVGIQGGPRVHVNPLRGRSRTLTRGVLSPDHTHFFVNNTIISGKGDLLLPPCSEADAESAKEYAAAVRIQSWFRGCILRGYITHLHSSASTIQKNYKGHRGREDYRKRLRVRRGGTRGRGRGREDYRG